MPQNQYALLSRLASVFALSALLACSAAMAQHTAVENNGAGGRIETDYNPADKITQMRTLGPDGKLQQKVDYEYLPGYYVAQQTDTSYWPNGEVRRVARNTYDASANFTGEFIELYDESGKVTAGHKLTHDPWTGVYRCSEWNIATRDYRAIECPAGEEESGEAPEIKKFTYDEVMRNLDAARQAARREQKIGHMQPATAVRPPITTVQQEVGLVFPAQLRPGARVSGSVVTDPEQYDEMPEVTVTSVAIPFESAGEASRLSGWWFEVTGEKPRRADGPIALVVPRRGSGLNITFRQAGNPSHSVSKTLTFSQATSEKPLPPKSFHAAALCLKGAICAVRGPFNGDGSKTFAAFEDHPAAILAETADMAYILIPELTAPGARPLFIAEGSKVVAFPMVVGELDIRNNHRELSAGQTLLMFPTLDGPGGIPDPEWQAGNFPGDNLEQAQRLIPGFNLPTGNSDARQEPEEETKREPDEPPKLSKKPEENRGGEILLVLKNVTPEQISLRASKNEMLVFRLSDEAFRRGPFKYDLLVEARKGGKVEVKGYVIPFLAPIAGQEFSIKSVR
jgi:hypothetical protein